MRKFINNHMEDHIDMLRDFEIKKRAVGLSSQDRVTLRVPIALSEVFAEESGETLKEALSQSMYAGKVTTTGRWLRGKLLNCDRACAYCLCNVFQKIQNMHFINLLFPRKNPGIVITGF